MAQHQETKNEKNIDYYMDIFQKLGMFNDNKVQETDSPFLENPKNIWNWNAFFFGPLWMMHRKIDSWPALLCLCLQLFFARIISLNLDNMLLISACSIAILALMTLFGYFGNRLYMIFAKYYISFGGLLLNRYRDAIFMGHHKDVLSCCFVFYVFYTVIIPKIIHYIVTNDAELYFWLFIFGYFLWFNIINALCFFRTWRDWKNFRKSREH